MNRDFTCKDIEDFREFLIASGKSVRTQMCYPKQLYDILKWADVSYLNEKIMSDYKAYMMIHKSPATVNLMISAFNMFVSYKRWDELKLVRVKDKKAKKTEYMTEREYNRLLRYAKKSRSDALLYIIQTIYILRIRAAELKLITVENISKGQFESLNGQRIYVVPQKLRIELLDYAYEKGIKSGVIFRNRAGNVIDRHRLLIMITKLAEDAGFESGKVSVEKIRHIKVEERRTWKEL